MALFLTHPSSLCSVSPLLHPVGCFQGSQERGIRGELEIQEVIHAMEGPPAGAFSSTSSHDSATTVTLFDRTSKKPPEVVK